MEDRIQPLIEERAAWLFKRTPWALASKAMLDRLLGYQETLRIGREVDPMTADALMRKMEKRLARRVTVTGRHNVPAQGAALIVANHPTGIADAVMLNDALRPIRSDLYYYANRDILRVLPQMQDIIAPVEWRPEKRNRQSLRDTMNYTREATEAGRLGVIFPSGRLAKRKGMVLHERPWMASAAMIARKFELPIIPVHITARNSMLFYLFDAIHPSLRDITLFYETLNKDKMFYHISIGQAISPDALPQTSEDGIEMLRKTVLDLGAQLPPKLARDWMQFTVAAE